MTDTANDRQKDIQKRNRELVLCNMAGILMNLLLAIGKTIAGFAVNSQMIILDGINSFSDMLSSVLAVIAAKVSTRKPNDKHPYGYGRLEYLASLAVTLIVMYIGIRAFIGSIREIFFPAQPPEYTVTVIVLMVISLIGKLVYGFFAKKKGRELTSGALFMSGTDSIGDAMIAASILVGIVVKSSFGLNIEPFLSLMISCLILNTAAGMIHECMSKILGTSADPELKKEIKKMIIMEDDVLNVSNLIIHSYGENMNVGSVDIEVDQNMTATEISRLSRRLIRNAEEFGLTLVTVGIVPANVTDPKVMEMTDRILEVIEGDKNIKRAHSFFIDFEDKVISFYVVSNHDLSEKDAALRRIHDEVQEMYPDMTIEIYNALDI